ncbi:MAG: WG repeat-containing protein [Bacteroidota bacterium]
MKIILSVLLFLSPFIINAQTYSTKSQGSNTVGGAYVAPIITKTYTVKSTGYQPPVRTSYSNYNYTSSAPSPFSTGSSFSGSKVSSAPRLKGSIYKDPTGKYGFTDGTGSILVAAIYDEVSELSASTEGIGYLKVKLNSKYGILWPYDKKPTVPVKYDDIKRINSSTVLVTLDKKMGIIEMPEPGKSNFAIPLKYDDIGPLDAYCLWVRSGDKFGLVSILNTTILPVKYQEIHTFSLTEILVKKDNKMGLMNFRGKETLPIEYESISTVANGVAWVIKNNKWGLINSKGELLAVPQYDTVYEQSEGKIWINERAIVAKEGKFFYLDKEGKQTAYNVESAKAVEKPERLTKIEENFDEENGKFKWPSNTYAKQTSGQYILTLEGDVNYKDPKFPPEFSFTAQDDWMLEVSMKKGVGGIGTSYGIAWGNLSSVLVYAYGLTFSGLDAGTKDFKIKKGFNTLKMIRRGKDFEVYFNSKNIITTQVKKLEGGTFSFTSSTGLPGYPVIVYFDDIKFEILKKN